MGQYLKINADIELSKDELFEKLTDNDLLNEMSKRDLNLSEVHFNKEELIKCLCNQHNILDSDKIKSFLSKLD